MIERATTRRAAPKRPAAVPRAPRPAGVTVPVSARALWRGAGWLVVVALLAVLAWLADVLGVPGRVGAVLGRTAVAAGFELTRVEVTGTRHVPVSTVKALAFGEGAGTLAVSPTRLRARLRALPWVADAVVARRLPDRLDVRIVERVPVARWAQADGAVLIDRAGTALPVASLAPFARLPLISGDGAPRELSALTALLAGAPPFARAPVAAAWIGGRRWNLRLAGGETVLLPEDYGAAAGALAALARLDARAPVLGRGFERIDLRVEGRMTAAPAPGARVEGAARAGPNGRPTGATDGRAAPDAPRAPDRADSAGAAGRDKAPDRAPGAAAGGAGGVTI